MANSKESEISIKALLRRRRAVLPMHRDPYGVLFDELKVRRVLTTNYDDEIDRHFEAQGYDVASHVTTQPGMRRDENAPSRSIMLDASGSPVEMMAYEAGAAAYLFDYGADTRERQIQVLHIHGRIRNPQSSFVLSERDYRDRYARDDLRQLSVDRAMRLVFTANPLLFLGLGMTEPDVLRPLRTFSGELPGLCDRPAIALMPRSKSESDPSAPAMGDHIESLARYGVYRVYYGKANHDNKPEFEALAQIVDVQDKLWKWLTKYIYCFPCKKIFTAPEKTFDRILFDLVDNVESNKSSANAVNEVILQTNDLYRLLHSWIGDHVEITLAQSCLSWCAGLSNMARTLFMTARLRRMVDDWRDWREDWAASPNPIEPAGPNSKCLTKDPIELVRSQPLLRDLDAESTGHVGKPRLAPSTDRFFAGAPSPAFQVLRASLTRNGAVRHPEEGRRVFYLLSARGTGRGHVFAAMRSPRRFAQFCHWLQIAPIPSEDSDEAARECTRYIDRAFLNLGLSQEVMSAFDRLTWFLEHSYARRCALSGATNNMQVSPSLRGDRIGRLSQIISAYNKSGEFVLDNHHRHRLVVCVNHAQTFFDEQGNTKNSQIRRLIEILFDPQQGKLPIDFIIMMNEDRAPTVLRRSVRTYSDYLQAAPGERAKDAPATPVLLNPADMPVAARRAMDQRIERIFGPRSKIPDHSAHAELYVHFLQAMHPATFAVRFFPRTALALERLGAENSPPGYQSLIRFPPPEMPSPAASPIEFSVNNQFIKLSNEEEIFEFQHKLRDTLNAKLFEYGSNTESNLRAVQQIALAFGDDRIDNIMMSSLKKFSDRNDQVGGNIKQIARQISADIDLIADNKKLSEGGNIVSWNSSVFFMLSSAVGGNRYAMTVTLAAVDDMITRRVMQDGLGVKPGGVRLYRVDLNPIRNYLDRLKLLTAGKPPTEREDIAITHALNLYQSDLLSSSGESLGAWPFTPKPFKRSDAPNIYQFEEIFYNKLIQASPSLVYDTQDQVLVVLALVGQPVEAEVLTGADTVARSLDSLVESIMVKIRRDMSIKSYEENEIKKYKPHVSRLCLETILDLLVARCLVFRISPREKPIGSGKHRFVTHKSVRRSIYRNMRAPVKDYSEIDPLALSLHAVQPGDLPRPTAAGQRRIRQLIEQLSLYGRPETAPPHGAFDPFLHDFDPDGETGGAGDGEKARRARRRASRVVRGRMRAANGAMRSIYSLGVICRFNSFEQEGVDPPEVGYFEEQRRRTRWLLRMANRLDAKWPRESGWATPELQKNTRILHSEEIVGLFNECGVISLAQGRIGDSIDLFNQARRLARDLIEQTGWGPLHVQIGLNKALSDIEGGQLREAEQYLTRILGESSREHPVIRLIADGYMAYIRDLRGDSTGAVKNWERVIDGLIAQSSFRAAAIFSGYLADSLRQRGGVHLDKAREWSERARALAANGDHQDIVQAAQLSYVFCDIQDGGRVINRQRRAEILETLDSIERYAKTMNISMLSCRQYIARCNLFYSTGDHRNASEYAEKALSIATMYNMELRKIAALAWLGVCMTHSEPPQARATLIHARELALAIDYAVGVSRIERFLNESRST